MSSMMIRSARIPPLLNRIVDRKTEGIAAALLVTLEGELLGCSSSTPMTRNSSNSNNTFGFIMDDPHSFGSLVADLCAEYTQLGRQELDQTLQTILLELEQGTVAVSIGECLVVALGAPSTPPGQLLARTQAAAMFVQESLMTLHSENA